MLTGGQMQDERATLTRQVLDLQIELYRSLRPAREWLEIDLTMPQMKVLFILDWEEAASMSKLAASLGVTLSTMTGIVDRLVEHGLLQRQENPQDRRLVLCRLTAAGAATVERLHQAGRDRLASVLSELSLSDLRTVAVGFDVLAQAARRERAASEVDVVRVGSCTPSLPLQSSARRG